MTAVKICGLREIEHVMAATKAGADYLGMIFATQSSRTVTPEQAQTMTSSLRASYGRAAPPVVGVFVNEIPERMNELADICGLDLLQLSGDEPWSIVQTLNRPVIKAVRVTADHTAEAVAAELARELPQLATRGGHCLVESHVTGRYGGTGQQMDWGLAAAVATRFPLLLSGGLAPENIAQAVGQVCPWGVDVSSGVETGGVKNSEKIRAFIAAVRAADAVAAAKGAKA